MILRFLKNKSGQGGGIGTLIIFIAIVLVAAIAAYVLIGTAGTLQSRSLQVGKESTTRVSTQIEIENVFGIANDTTLNRVHCIQELVTTIKLSPGSTPIDLERLLLQFATGNILITRIYYNESLGDIYRNKTLMEEIGTNNSAPDFYAKQLVGNGDMLLEPEESFQLNYFIEEEEPYDLMPQERFALMLKPREGTEQTVEATVPSQITMKYTRLYP